MIYFVHFAIIAYFSYLGGGIKIFREEDENSFKLIAEASDPDPIPVEYVSFGSWDTNLVKFYFNCSFSLALSKKDFFSAE